jgi:cell volume regulation protein A
MFLLLGLLVSASRLAFVAGSGLALALFLALFARPVVAAICLAPFRFSLRENLYVGWVGLRGAVPIVLATYPVLMGAPAARQIFDLVFFIVVANAIIPGATVRQVTRWLGLESPEQPQPKAVLEVNSLETTLKGELMSFYIDPAVAVTGVSVADLPFPEGAAATLIVRDDELIAPTPTTVVEPGDHIYVVCRPEDVPLVQLMFGRPEA